tara:strand:+ start:1492 stop:1785 length:294 start_codon:yes stop_codon:yes gene_type:complete
MNLFDIYFAVMGGAPPQRPVYTPPPAPAPVSPPAAAPTTKKASSPASSPSPVDNAVAAREKTASNKRRGRTSLITNMGGAPGLGDDDAGRKPKLGGY